MLLNIAGFHTADFDVHEFLYVKSLKSYAHPSLKTCFDSRNSALAASLRITIPGTIFLSKGKT